MTWSAGQTITHRLINFTLPPLPEQAGSFLWFLAIIVTGLLLVWLPLQWVLLLLAGVIFLIVTLLKPLLGLYALIPIIPFSTLLATAPGGFKVGLMELVLVWGLMAWLVQRSVQATSSVAQPIRLLPKLGSAPLAGPFILFLGGVLLSWLTTFSIGASLIETAKWVEMLALYLFVVSLLSPKNIPWLVAIILLAGAAQALLGIYQFVFKVGPEGFLLFDGRFLRAYGSFAQPNPYAGYLGLVLPLALALTYWQLTKSKGQAYANNLTFSRHYLLLILYAVCLVLLLAALFASQSRGAWLGAAVAMGVTLAAQNKNIALATAMLALVGVVVALAGWFNWGLVNTGQVLQRFSDAFAIAANTDITATEVNDANFATIERLAHWQAAQAMWRDQLWLGVGFGNYAAIYPAYAIGRWLDPLGHAHNYLLNIGAEAGLVGIGAYLIFWILVFKVSWLALWQSYGFQKAVVAGGIGILVHLHIHNLFDNLFVQGMYLHIAVVLAFISIIYQCNLTPIKES
jgi:O-antigen ligase